MTNDPSDLERIAWVRALCAAGAVAGIRLAARVSMRELAGVVGVTAASVHRWESGTAQPTGERALAYADALERLGARRRPVRSAS